MHIFYRFDTHRDYIESAVLHGDIRHTKTGHKRFRKASLRANTHVLFSFVLSLSLSRLKNPPRRNASRLIKTRHGINSICNNFFFFSKPYAFSKRGGRASTTPCLWHNKIYVHAHIMGLGKKINLVENLFGGKYK